MARKCFNTALKDRAQPVANSPSDAEHYSLLDQNPFPHRLFRYELVPICAHTIVPIYRSSSNQALLYHKFRVRSYRVTFCDIVFDMIRDQTITSPSYRHTEFFLHQCCRYERISTDANALTEPNECPIVTVTVEVQAVFVFFIDKYVSAPDQAGQGLLLGLLRRTKQIGLYISSDEVSYVILRIHEA